MKRTVILLVILALLVGGLAGCKKTAAPPEVGTRGTIERTGVIDVNGDGIVAWNGGTLATYSDAGDTLTWSVTGSTGDLVAGDQITFEGATADAYETIFAITDPTSSDKTITFPNSTGTVALNPYGESIEFEGATANEFETTVSVTDPTADNVITIPNETAAVMVSSLTTNATDAANAVTGASNALAFEGATADGYETILTPTDATADRTVTLPDASGTLALTSENGFFFPLTADATAQVGDLVMPDAGTTNRFDVNTGNAAMPLGVLAGTGPSAQGTTGYPIVFAGLGRCAIQEDAAVTFSHWLIVSATAGKCNDSAAITTIGLNIGRALESAPVSNVIAHNGCTGGAGCINTALDTPNAGPAGQITLSADVAAQGWAVGDPVIYWNSGGTTPTGLTDGKVYFLASVATTNVTLSATKGGAVVVPSDQGDDATQYLQKLPLAAIHIN